jgi:CMP-N-acetylneuraminic acid synthetase
MLHGKTIVALVPARSGSKGIPHKNIIDFRGKPLLAHSIEHGRASRYIDEVYVSTDSSHYADIASSFGALVPFLRPAEFAGDLSTDFEVFDHFLSYLRLEGSAPPDILVQLRPTYPTRRIEFLDAAIEYFVEHYEDADSLRSVAEAPETPYKMWRQSGIYLEPLLSAEGIEEPYNSPRQALPKVYLQNACIDIIKTETVTKKRSMSGDKILMFEMAPEEIHDIDTNRDLVHIQQGEV